MTTAHRQALSNRNQSPLLFSSGDEPFHINENGHAPPPDIIDDTIYYNFLHYMPIVCVDVAICYMHKILLIKRKNEPAKGEWWLPGGRLCKFELLNVAAWRKAKTETGLVCAIKKRLLAAETAFDTGPGNTAVHSINFCYFLTPQNNKVTLDKTSSDYKWINKIKKSYHPYIKDCLKKAFEYDI